MLSITLWLLDTETLRDWDYKIKPLERRHFLGYLDILNVLLMSACHPKPAKAATYPPHSMFLVHS